MLHWWGVLFPSRFTVEQTYYVDVVNLPVASPQAGHPSQKGSGSEAPTPPLPDERMNLPQSQAKTSPQDKAKPDAAAADSEAFAKRMAKLEGKADSRRQEAALARVRKDVAAGTGRAGMPGGTGTD